MHSVLFFIVPSSAQGQACGATASSAFSSQTLQNACDIIPKFFRIEVSDTGDYIPWNGAALLKRGDHVAWLRFASYYHHAIVVEVNDGSTITVVELSWTGNAKNVRQTRTCGCSPLYRVYYPDNILVYTPDQVVQRAENLVNPDTSVDVEERGDGTTFDEGVERVDVTPTTVRKGWRPWNTCEHTATWCKVNCSRCGQWRILFFCTFLTYIRRPLESLIHVSLVVSCSEYFPKNSGRHDVIGIGLLLSFEIAYLIIVACLIRYDFKKGRHFISNQGLSAEKRMWCAFLKTLLQSIVMISAAIGFGVGVKNAIKNQHGPWIAWCKRLGVESWLGLLGGIIGNAVGFLLFFFIPHQAFDNNCFALCAHIGRFFTHRRVHQPIQ